MVKDRLSKKTLHTAQSPVQVIRVFLSIRVAAHAMNV